MGVLAHFKQKHPGEIKRKTICHCIHTLVFTSNFRLVDDFYKEINRALKYVKSHDELIIAGDEYKNWVGTEDKYLRKVWNW